MRKVPLLYLSNKLSYKRKLEAPSSPSIRISKTYQNIIIFKWCGPSPKSKQISASIFGHLQISAGIFRYL